MKGLFVTDFDGTIFRSDRRIHRKDRETLQRLQRLGILRVIATGRSLESFRKAVFGMELPIDYVVFSSGAGLIDWQTGTIEQTEGLGHTDIQNIVSIFEDLEFDYMIHEPIPENHRFYYRSRHKDNSDFFHRIAIYKDYCSPLTPDAMQGLQKATQGIAILSPRKQDIDLAVQRLQRYSVIRTTSPLNGESIWIEVFPKGVSKSRGTAALCTKFDIPRNRVCATGNDYNDLDLLQWAGCAFVAPEAPEELLRQFPTIPNRDGSAISGAIDTWISQL